MFYFISNLIKDSLRYIFFIISFKIFLGEHTAEVTWHERVPADRRGDPLDQGKQTFTFFSKIFLCVVVIRTLNLPQLNHQHNNELKPLKKI